MLDSFLKFLGLETKEKNPAPKNWTWQKPKEKESTKIFLKIKNAIYKQTEEIIMNYDKGKIIKMIKTQRPISNEEVEVEITKEYQSIKGC
ncbi:hypothetical protein [Campylobacter sp.]|uniref:hypothetical protein n=1 Tax=Campylobacter sp. TaxID=205 RepID=UPI002A7F975B|nr:hypothetical protein [Campylobacter sp.]MDY4445734.1 hypothetical protein [Campylobacter sp.]